MPEHRSVPLERSDFVARLVEWLELASSSPVAAAIDPDQPLEHLGIDSLGRYELLLAVEDLAGSAGPDEPPVLDTLADAYRYYRDLVLTTG